jgi:hypothetical protein
VARPPGYPPPVTPTPSPTEHAPARRPASAVSDGPRPSSPGIPLVVAGLLAARLAIDVARWSPGWSALTWDDFSRTWHAMTWAREPFFAAEGVWLPLHTWVVGAVLWLGGGLFDANPLLAAAVVNAAAGVGAAAVSAGTALRLVGSRGGALLVFAAVLFAPWNLYASLSGLSEALVYLCVAGLAWAAVAWWQERSPAALLAGAAAVAAAAALRYELWSLVVVWPMLVAWPMVRARHESWPVARWITAGAAAVLPAAVPLGWLGYQWRAMGDPLWFTAASAEAFTAAYGTDLFTSSLARLVYYPLGLLRADPVLVPVLVVLAVVAVWVVPAARPLVWVSATPLVALVATAVLAHSVGAFTERFLFAVVVGLAPLLGVLPAWLAGLPRHRAVAVGTAAAVLVAGGAVQLVRIANPPQEWTHAPDLLALAEALGSTGEPLVVGLGPGMEDDWSPIDVRNGDRVTVLRPVGGSALPAEVDVWVERLPHRVAATPGEAVIGRFHLSGPRARSIAVDDAACACDQGWQRIDEQGIALPAGGGPYLAVEFTSDDPPPGSVAALYAELPPAEESRRGSLRLRSLYGHGFNPGRVIVEVRDPTGLVHAHDLAERSRWQTIRFTVPPEGGTVEVRLVAQPDIEAGWAWGRASTTLVTTVQLDR